MPPDATQPIDADELEAHAIALIEKLPDPLRSMVHEAALIYTHYPRWVILLGHVMRSHEAGQLFHPLTDYGWQPYLRAVQPLVVPCAHCGQTFTPKFYRQPYCSNECGLAAEQLAKAVKAAA